MKTKPKSKPIITWLYVGVALTLIIAIGVFAWGGFTTGSPIARPDSQTAPVMAEGPRSTDTPTPSPTWTATNTPMPPTNTPTSSPSPTSSPTAMPSTATPTLSPTPSLTPSPTATSSSTPVASPTATPTLTPSLPMGTFALLNPLDLDEPVYAYQLVNFEWEWIGIVPPDLGFEVRVWREGEPQAGAHNAVLDNTEGKIEPIGENKYRLAIDITEAAGVRSRSGEYWWTVSLVQVSPEYADLGRQADPGLLRFEFLDGSGDDGDGGSGGGTGSSGGTGGVK